MDPELIKTFGQVAGIGGLGLGVFLLIAREIVQKSIFSTLTKQQSSKIILALAFMAWTTALAGIGAWTYTYLNPPPPILPNQKNMPLKGFPSTTDEKGAVKEVLSYLQIQLTLRNEVYKLFSTGLDKADEYNRYPTPSGYEALTKTIQFKKKEMRELLEQNHPLSNSLQTNLSGTPVSIADLGVLYDQINLDVRELSERLDFMLVLLNPDMPFNAITRDKWISIMREAHRQGVRILSYAVCEFLLPINPRELVDFRKEFLPGLTAFEGDAFDFSLDETQLQQLQIAAQRKRTALGDELATLVGGMNVSAQVAEAILQQKN